MSNPNECPTCGGPKPCKKCNVGGGAEAAVEEKKDALKNAEFILHKVIGLGTEQVVKFIPNPQNQNFNQTPYSAFQQQTGLTITVNNVSITSQQFDEIEKNDITKKALDKIAVLFSDVTAKPEQSAGTEKSQRTSSTPFKTNPFSTRPSR
jgi:hypothetical protein